MPFKKPNFFIVGAARAGTTALWYSLKENPHVFMPEELSQKEPAFFSELKNTRFNQFEHYMKLFEEISERHRGIGEATTAYLTDPVSAGRIYEFNPETRIIIIVRNPVSRAYSLYNWMVQEGYEYAGSFEEALELEGKRIYKKIPNYFEPEYFYNYLYFHSGLYYEQVKRYVDLFKKNVLVIKFEDYINNFHHEWEKICSFLDIESIKTQSRIACINESKQVYSPLVQFILRKITQFYFSNKKFLENIEKSSHFKKIVFSQVKKDLKTLSDVTKISFSHRTRIFYLLSKILGKLHSKTITPTRKTKEERDLLVRLGQREKKPAKMKHRTSQYLQDKYKEDVAKLSALIGIDFSNWQM